MSLFADGLPPQVLGIGGAMDVAFIGHTAYVLVTMVGGDIVGGPHIGDDTVGIYRLDRDGSFTVIADIGAWSVAPTRRRRTSSSPPACSTPCSRYHRGFLVTDGHHNRVLRVSLDGAVSEAGHLRQHRADRARHARATGVHEPGSARRHTCPRTGGS